MAGYTVLHDPWLVLFIYLFIYYLLALIYKNLFRSIYKWYARGPATHHIHTI